MRVSWIGAMPLALAAAAAGADVKAGVDAWERGDFARALVEWRAPATAGDADAQFNLGQAYKLGRGVPVDLATAQSWYRKAALQGHAQAEDNLGLALFQDGRKDEALPWLEKAVARDERRAELVLGTMLFNGDGIAKDWARAYALVTRSSQQGLPQGSKTLAQMDQYVPAEQKQAGIALATRIAQTARLAGIAPAAPGASLDGGITPAIGTAPVRVAASQTARVAPSAVPVTKPGRGGAWRIQLGAFRDEGNARDLWARVGARTGGSPAYVRAGGITRLQASGFASRAEARAACGRAAASCVVVAP